MTATLVTLDWWVLAPVLAPACGALLVLVLDALAPRARGVHLPVGLVALGCAIGALPYAVSRGAEPTRTLCLPGPSARCFYEATSWGVTLQLVALTSSLLVLLMLGPGTVHVDRGQRGGPAVTVALVLTATAGAALVPVTRDLPTWLIAIELATLPAIALIALSRAPGADGGALSLLMVSLTSFALLAVGLGLWILATGDPTFSATSVEWAWQDTPTHRAQLLATLFLIAGLGFKLSAVPFHAWTPGAFVTCDEPIAALLATTSKVAALSGLVVLLQPAIVLAREDATRSGSILVVLGIIAVASMTLGNLVALRCDDPVRLLAWSTIAQGGWLVLPVATLSAEGVGAAVGYLGMYAVATLALFAVVAVLSPANEGAGGRRLADYAGLARSRPWLAGVLGLALVCLAGLPPGFIGVLAKVVALRPVVGGQHWWLVAAAIANVVLGIAVYLRWLLIALRPAGSVGASSARAASAVDTEPRFSGETSSAERDGVRLDPGLLVALALSTSLLAVLSVAPGLLFTLAMR
ncbi:NADH-quinone oxidoreductase subunit N [Nostocoides vanveenii]|uniref:NADH-quinone oxidoreductase subunit N n=1 Tax=Nostocoides vanveenii TaxID=330835 RepID=A0ABP4WTW3_9MICO